MKRFFKFFICSIFIVTLALCIYAYSNRYKLDIIKEGIESSLLLKGCEDATAITGGDDLDVYISFKNEIVRIDKNTKINKVYKDSSFNIQDIAYKDRNLYVLSDGNLILIDSNENIKVLRTDLPYGENVYRNLLVNGDSILISIGSKTNSGIAKEGEEKDISPINLILNGVNYGEKNTGAFKDYAVKSKKGEKILGEEIGTASIFEFNTKNEEFSLFASGIKNVKGYDVNSKGEIIATVGGIEEGGERGVIRDTDYIYKIAKGLWYGWPDFSGGDPISSQRFTNDKRVKPLIKNPPEKIGQTPSYQHNSVNSLGKLVVDRNGSLVSKDSIIFSDYKTNTIYLLDDKKVLSKILKMEDDSYIKDMMFLGDECIILDSSNGCIYKLSKNEKIIGVNIPYGVVAVSLVIMLALLIILVNKIKRKNI